MDLDLAKHLRTIHFTLVVTCIGLVVTASIAPGTRLENAYQQAKLAAYLDERIPRDVLEILNEWRSVPPGSGLTCLERGGAACWLTVTASFDVPTAWIQVTPIKTANAARALLDFIGSNENEINLPVNLRLWRTGTEISQATEGDFRTIAPARLRLRRSALVPPIGSPPDIEHLLEPPAIQVVASTKADVAAGMALRLDISTLAPPGIGRALEVRAMSALAESHQLVSALPSPRRRRIPSILSPELLWVDEKELLAALEIPARAGGGRSLEEFARAWDRLLELGEVLELGSPHLEKISASREQTPGNAMPTFRVTGARFVPPRKVQRSNQISDLIRRSNVRGDTWLLATSGPWSDEPDATTVFDLPFGQNGWHGPNIEIPSNLQGVGINLLAGVLDKNHRAFGTTSWFAAPFRESFPEFVDVVEGLESTSVLELRDYLERLRRDEGPEISLFGATIPQRALSTWGLAILTIILVYFAIHLRRFRRQIESSGIVPDFPWIGLYDDRASRALCVASIALLPGAVSIYIVYSGSIAATSPWVIAGLVAELVATLFLAGYASWMCLRSTRTGGQQGIKSALDS